MAENENPPNRKENSGRFPGIVTKKGDALAFWIWEDDAEGLIEKYVFHSADDLYNPNERVTTSRGEDYPHSESKVSNLNSFDDVVDVVEINLPQVDSMYSIGRSFLLPHNVGGLVHLAEVMRRVDMVDVDMDQYLVRLGDGT